MFFYILNGDFVFWDQKYFLEEKKDVACILQIANCKDAHCSKLGLYLNVTGSANI